MSARPSSRAIVVFACACLPWAGPAAREARAADPSGQAEQTTPASAATSQPAARTSLGQEEASRVEQLQKTVAEFRDRGTYAEAVPAAEEILHIRRKAQGEDWYETADARRSVDTLRLAAALPPEGQAELAEADRVDSRVPDLYAQGQYEQALALTREQLAVRRKLLGEAHSETIGSLNNLAVLLYAVGDLEGAEAPYREALVVGRKILGGSHPHVAASLNNLGALLQEKGDLGGAELAYRESLELRQKLVGEDDPALANSLHNLAALLKTKGDYDGAEALFRRVLDMDRRLRGEETAHFAGTLHNLGVVLQDKGDHEQAEIVLRRALAIRRKLHGDRHRSIGDALNSLALCLKHVGRRAEAEQSYREAVSAFHGALGDAHPVLARTRSNLAVFLAEKEDAESLAEAERLFAQALESLRRSDSPSLYVSCTRYADLLLRRRGRPADALPLYAEAISEMERLRTRVLGDELDRARYFGELSGWDPFGGMARAQVRAADFSPRGAAQAEVCGSSPASGEAELGPSAAYSSLERGRSRALLDLLERGGRDLYGLALERAAREKDGALREKVESIRRRELQGRAGMIAAERQLAALNRDAGLTEQQRQELLEKLAAERNRARDAERDAVRDLFELARGDLASGSLRAMTADQVAGLLGAGEVLLAYAVGPLDSILLAVSRADAGTGPSITSPGATVRAFHLTWPDGSAVDSDSLTATVAGAFGEISREPPAAGPLRNSAPAHSPAELYAALIPAELADAIRVAPCLHLVPDGALHRLPFETLIVDRSRDLRWVDEGPSIAYGPSGTVLMNRRQRAATRRGTKSASGGPALVALADPTFSSEERDEPPSTADAGLLLASARTRGSFASLTPLPGTRAEAEAVAAIVRRTAPAVTGSIRLLTGRDATVANLFRAADRPRFLHLATHGLAEGGREAYESALALSVPDRLTAEDFGFLRLSDLLDRWGGKLEGTELVTLSACRTARGKLETGEGFVALTWGFLYAGADSVLASLWKVDDTATALLMTRFYRNLLEEKMAKAAALLEAKRWLRSLTASQVEALAADLSPAAPARGATYVREPGPPAAVEHPYADPFFWGAFVLVGDGS